MTSRSSAPLNALARVTCTCLILVCAWAAGAGAQGRPAGPPVRLVLPPGGISMPMQDFGGRPVVQVYVNGEPHFFIFDTGAQGSVIDSAAAAQAGLPVVGEQLVGSPGGDVARVPLVRVDRLGVGGAEVALSMPAVNLRAMARGAPNAPSGVLSAALFGDNLLTLDYPARRVLVGPGSLGEPNGRDVLSVDLGARLPTVPVVVGDRTVVVHLDTGSPESLALPLAYADSLPLQAPPVRGPTVRRIGGEIATYTARLNGRLRLGPLTIENPEIRFLDVPAGTRGNVGQVLLSRMVITLDRAHGRVRLELPATPSRP